MPSNTWQQKDTKEYLIELVQYDFSLCVSISDVQWCAIEITH